MLWLTQSEQGDKHDFPSHSFERGDWVEWYQPATRYCGTCKALDFSAVASQSQTEVGEQCVQGQEEKQDSQRDV
jgi:hypothetical protein